MNKLLKQFNHTSESNISWGDLQSKLTKTEKRLTPIPLFADNIDASGTIPARKLAQLLKNELRRIRKKHNIVVRNPSLDESRRLRGGAKDRF